MSRRAALIGIAVGLAMIGLASAIGSEPRLVYNPSESAPRGWYVVHPAAELRIGDYVIVRLPRDVALFAAQHRYLPLGVPALKRIAAMAGQRVCVADRQVLVDGLPVARTRLFDGQQRPLRAWLHCRELLSGELFLLNADSAASFDSRYFGPVDVSFVRGRATALENRE